MAFTNIVFGFKFFQVDGDIEKPSAKKRRTEDSGSGKNTQNGKKRKRDEESDVSPFYHLFSVDALTGSNLDKQHGFNIETVI